MDMNRLFLLLAVWVSSTAYANAQFEKRIKGTDVKNVRIYQSGAQVERSLATSVEPGTTSLFIEGLSAAVDPRSIYVNGTGDVTVAGISYQLDYLTNERKPLEVRRLEDSLRVLNNDIDKVNSLEQVYNDEMALLNANRSVGGANIGVDVDNLREVADFFRARMIDLKEKQMEVRAEQRKLKERQERLNKQLAELNAKNSRPQGTIVIDIIAKAAAKVSLKVVYYTTGAAWSPAYEIAAASLTQPVKLSYKAEVVQSCNEDWEDVRLTLSTGNPSIGGQKPHLHPWYLNFYEPVPFMKGARSAQMEMAEPAAMAVMADGAVNTMESYVTVQEGATSTDFDIALPYTVRGDGKPVTVEIRSYDLPASYTYYAAPKVDRDAFLLARIAGWDQLNLLPGPAKVYYEGNYVGESAIDTRQTIDTLDLSLGRDKRIVITREAKSEMTRSRTVGGNTVREQVYSISVRNTRKEKIALLLEDQLPVAQNTDIKVSDREFSGGELEEATGKVSWRMDLAPGATENRTLGYTVKYPKNKVVTGF